jgi:hypothetical protein
MVNIVGNFAGIFREIALPPALKRPHLLLALLLCTARVVWPLLPGSAIAVT